jgi:hypothetical protein
MTSYLQRILSQGQRAADNCWHGAIKFRGVRAPPISSTWRIWETCAIDPQWIDSARLCEVRFDG